MTAVAYETFLAGKRRVVEPAGFQVANARLPEDLFGFQRDIVRWACRLGRAAVFAGTGLGKTAMQLAWSEQVVNHTRGAVLILAPLAVAEQTVHEAQRFGVHGVRLHDPAATHGIVVTNYEKLHQYDPARYAGIVLDESSILKAYSGKIRNQIIESFAATPYRLACTATPAPNDYMELGNHAEFLGVMSRTEMLATFFVHDGGETQKWRLKGHAEQDFWRWLCSWAVLMRKPSDLGRLYADDDYELPPLTMHRITVESAPQAGQLFAMEAQTLSERRGARRATISDRVQACAELVNASDEQWLIWCDLNDEGDALEKLIPDAVQVAGRHSDDEKARKMTAFATGEARVLVSKPSICGFGMNWQNCHNVVFVGLSDSWESYYQAIRRCWRFGQTHEVYCYVITSTADGAVVANIERKERDATRMIDEAVAHTAIYQDITRAVRADDEYVANVVMQLPIWITAKAQVPA